jgi:hypothetical protein
MGGKNEVRENQINSDRETALLKRLYKTDRIDLAGKELFELSKKQ